MTTISIDQGLLKGAKCCTDKGNEYYEFLCVPYAKPPVGKLRFKSPEIPEPWDGVRDATTASQNQVAAQMDLLKRHYIGNEDCLYLNVYTPKLPDGNEKLLPVMFHIHGGGFAHGNGVIKAECGPDYLIDNNVVVVSINYRLSIFGFLALDLPEAAGNMGLKDQVQALIWVQKNIDKFGGDKNNVTLFGVSAGAASIDYLIVSPKAQGLFHKAILQSGSCINHWAINTEPQKILQKLLQRLKFEGSTHNQKAIYEYLMTCPPDLLIEESFKAMEESNPERLFFGFVPTIEKDFGNGEALLTTKPYKLLKEGKFSKVPVIKGFCEMEGYLMSLIKPSNIEELNVSKNFIKHFAYSMETVDEIKINEKLAKAYNINNSDDEKVNRNVIDFFSDCDFISGISLSGRTMSEYGVDVYLYKFSYDGKINFLKNVFNIDKKGAAHADDSTYIFKTDNISNKADESDAIVSDKLTKLWTNFAKTSNPALPVPVSDDFSTWPLFTQSSTEYLTVDKTFTIESFRDSAKMEIFKEIYDKYEQ